MALSRKSLGFPTQVAAGTTSTVYSVTSNQTTFIRTVGIHNRSVGSLTDSVSTVVQIYVVPNNGGAVRTPPPAQYAIGRLALPANDTFFFEPHYPIVLDNTGDSLQIYNEGTNNSGVSSTPVNVFLLGDKEV